MPEANSRVNDFAFKLANVNGTGSASRERTLMRRSFGWGFPSPARTRFRPTSRGFPPGMKLGEQGRENGQGAGL